MHRKRITLAQQGVWRIDSRGPQSLPLAMGYLKATAYSDEAVRAETDIRVLSFSGMDSTLAVISRMLTPEIPDMIAFSIAGWNYHLFGRVAETYRQMNSSGWVVWGGTHVTNQAERVFRMYPDVDIVVNGEGELTFLELVWAFLAGTSKRELHSIQGLSFRDPDGRIVTTPPRPRITDLDIIPSPFLTGALELKDPSGRFAYTSALMETNRGCPYACAFCYWGGAIGQKIRSFSMERLEEEIGLLCLAGAERIDLCDANFGILRTDEQFVEICIRAREKYGRPTEISTSWAKNKGETFYRIVRRMKQAGFHSAFNLALQSLSDPVLQDMGRKNMKLNEWEDLAIRLRAEGMSIYSELIWGCPGETPESFLEGYDRLARHVNRIAVYPHLMLPNTDYSERRKEFGFVTFRGEGHDFELILAHKTMTMEQNRHMHRFLFWARAIAEHLVFRNIWEPLDKVGGISQSQVLLRFDEWLDGHEEPALKELRNCRDEVVAALEVASKYIERALAIFYGDPDVWPLLREWWREAMLPLIEEDLRPLFADIFLYEWMTLPVYAAASLPLQTVDVAGESRFVRADVPFDFDVPAFLAAVKNGEPFRPARRAMLLSFHYKPGFCNDIGLYHNTHHEAYFGMPAACMASAMTSP